MTNKSQVAQPFRKMVSTDLNMVFQWRNHHQVRLYMFNSSEMTYDAHVRWFQAVKDKAGRDLLIYQELEKSLGFLSVTQSDTVGVVDWGFYLSPEAERGTGQKLGRAALDYLFRERSLHKVCGQVLAFNEKSINFHKKLGFDVEGVLKHQHYDGEKYIDVIHFGLLQSEWLNFKKVVQ